MRNDLRPWACTAISLALGLVFGCGTSSSPGAIGTLDGAPDAPIAPDALAPGDALLPADGPSCSTDATETSCCCEGDVETAPSCSADGTLTCGSGFGLYHGADCSCTAGVGPCCPAGAMDASHEASDSDAPAADADADAMGPDAAAAPDSAACTTDAQIACCCEGDIVMTPSCGAHGLTCNPGYGLYFGSDCSCSSGEGPCCLAGGLQ